jgi:hypothetical protein
MLFGDVRRETVGWQVFTAEPAEGVTGRDVDALHSTPACAGCLPHIKKGERNIGGGRSVRRYGRTARSPQEGSAGRFGLAVRCANLRASERWGEAAVVAKGIKREKGRRCPDRRG